MKIGFSFLTIIFVALWITATNFSPCGADELETTQFNSDIGDNRAITIKKCTCENRNIALEEHFQQDDVIFYGRVHDIIFISGYEYLAKFLVEEPFKIFDHTNVTFPHNSEAPNAKTMSTVGSAKKMSKKTLKSSDIYQTTNTETKNFLENLPVSDKHYIYIYYNTLPSNCYATFSLGEKYLVYAKYDRKMHLLTVNSCSGTAPAELVAKDLQKLISLQN